MKKLLWIAGLFILAAKAYPQKYFTRTGTLYFEAGTSMEDIDAVNKSVTSVLDGQTGRIEFAVLIKGFEFKRALMQEHFNENYMESSKYPKSVFKGMIINIKDVSFKQAGTYAVTVKGALEIHGVQRNITANGSFKIRDKGIQAVSKFTINLDDYKISIPGIVKDKISPVVNISVNCNYAPLNQ